MIVYGGSLAQVKKQLSCKHDWVGPLMDDNYRYNKCRQCYCVDRDVHAEDDDPVGEHLDKFVRRYFEVLEELRLTRATREESLRISEERRIEIRELKEDVERLTVKADTFLVDWMASKHEFGVKTRQLTKEIRDLKEGNAQSKSVMMGTTQEANLSSQYTDRGLPDPSSFPLKGKVYSQGLSPSTPVPPSEPSEHKAKKGDK